MLEVCYSNTEEQQCWLCVILIQRSSGAGSVLFKYRGAAALVVFIQLQRSSSAGSVLFYCRGEAVLVVCYSKTEEQQCWKCVI